MENTIKLKQESIFYRINNVGYARDDNLYNLGIFLFDKENKTFDLTDVSKIEITLIRPDNSEIKREAVVVNAETGEIKVEFIKNEVRKIGTYEAFIRVFKKDVDMEIIFQGFLFNVFQHHGVIQEADNSGTNTNEINIAISEDEPINNAQIWVKPVLNK